MIVKSIDIPGGGGLKIALHAFYKIEINPYTYSQLNPQE